MADLRRSCITLHIAQKAWHSAIDRRTTQHQPKAHLAAMRLMRLMPIYQKPNTSKPRKGHKTYPYLLGGLRVERPNQVWCTDISYIPRCLIPWFDGAILSQEWKDALWDKFVTEAPRPRTLSEQQYNDRRLRSRR